jgi:transcriptional regulator with XRE-family HTH domain
MKYDEWIREARKRSGMSQHDLANGLKVTKGNVSAWERGRHRPPLEHVYSISRITGAPLPDEVAGLLASVAQPATGVMVPLLANSASMGPGDELLDMDVMQGSITLSPTFIATRIKPARPAALRFIHARGDSMEPTFSSGDILLVDSDVREIKIDGVYVLEAYGRLFIKRVRQRMDGALEVSSDNPTHKTADVLQPDHQVKVAGRVLWVWNGRKL